MKDIPAIDMVATGKNIVLMRKNAGLTVKDIQQHFGFESPQAVYKWQRGVTMPSIENLIELAKLLGVSVEKLVVVNKE